jgi:hypothetical protein
VAFLSTGYDAAVLQKYADRLYRRANWLIFRYVLAGIGLGLLLGYSQTILWYWFTPAAPMPTNDPALIIVLAVIGGVVLGLFGEGKAFRYKLEAQTVLCQMQIERNTRRIAEPNQSGTAQAI